MAGSVTGRVYEKTSDPVERLVVDTVDGCEILHHQPDGWNMLKLYEYSDKPLINCRISSIHCTHEPGASLALAGCGSGWWLLGLYVSWALNLGGTWQTAGRTVGTTMIYGFLFEGSLEVKLPTIWTDGKSRGGKSQRGEEKKWEEQRRERVRRKKMQVREKVGKSRFTVFFHWFVALGGQKVGSLKRRARSHLARWEIKNCTPLWREARFQVKMHKTPHVRSTFSSWAVEKRTPSWREAHVQVKMYKTPHVRTTFGSWDVEKVHAVVVRSTFPSQNVQSTTCSHFWKLSCWKSARRCGEKHISKSRVSKTDGFGPLFNVQMSKKCTQSWREAHFQVKMFKTRHVRTTFGSCHVEKVHAVAAWSTFRSQKCQNLGVLSLFWRSDVE